MDRVLHRLSDVSEVSKRSHTVFICFLPPWLTPALGKNWASGKLVSCPRYPCNFSCICTVWKIKKLKQSFWDTAGRVSEVSERRG